MVPETVGPSQDPEEQERLIRTLARLASSRTWGDAAAIVQQNRFLYDPAVDASLGRIAEAMRPTADPRFAKTSLFWRDFLRHCRESGIVSALEAAGASLITAPESAEPLLRRAAELERRHSAGDDTALTELAELWTRLADASPHPDHPSFPAIAHFNLGGVLSRMPDAADRAVAAIRTAIRLLPASSVYRPAFLHGLARALVRQPDPAGLREAMTLLEEAVRGTRGPPPRPA